MLLSWLNEHCGCDMDKVMRGDEEEIEKMKKHLELETERIRNQYEDEE
ncbi:hypothetical protein IFU39_16620 [Paenibacillus sp. CFBP 13594]|nr:hypothetical protein [Paenibacillus sp. CFBP 13594]MBD8839438.1 hypothetical protein [Paenibacillus sp. CFBP 13594]